MTSPRFDFSYSGIKTAVLRYVETHAMKESIEARRKALATIAKPKLEDYLANCDKQTLDLVASFQRINRRRSDRKDAGAGAKPTISLHYLSPEVSPRTRNCVSASNGQEPKQGMPVYFPSRPLSTDNAAMIAAAAYPKFLTRDFAALDFSAEAGMG